MLGSARGGFCIESCVFEGVLVGLGNGIVVELVMVFLFRTVSDIVISCVFRVADLTRLDGFLLSAGQLDRTLSGPSGVTGGSSRLLSTICRELQSADDPIKGADEPLLASLLLSLERFDRVEEPVEPDLLGSPSLGRPRGLLVELLDTIVPPCAGKLPPLGTVARHIGLNAPPLEASF